MPQHIAGPLCGDFKAVETAPMKCCLSIVAFNNCICARAFEYHEELWNIFWGLDISIATMLYHFNVHNNMYICALQYEP
jgi:hypothetical protein